jgi:hypothetical protein
VGVLVEHGGSHVGLEDASTWWGCIVSLGNLDGKRKTVPIARIQ